MRGKSKRVTISIIICLFFVSGSICIAFIIGNINERKYQLAQKYYDSEQYSEAKKLYSNLGRYKDSESLEKKAEDYVEIDQIYNEAEKAYDAGEYKEAIENFENISGFRDSEQRAKEAKFKLAIQYFENEDYDASKQLFMELDGFDKIDEYLEEIDRKKVVQLTKAIYDKADDLFKADKYKEALENFNSILDYKDSQSKAKDCEDAMALYNQAIKYYNEKQYSKALPLFNELGGYEQSQEFVKKCESKMEMHRLSTTISAGLRHSTALTSDGKVVCTDSRYNFDGWNDIISISGFGTMTIGLKEDGTVELEGMKDIDDVEGIDVWEADVSEWKDIIQVSSGQQHVVGLKSDGKVVSAGLDAFGLSKVNGWKHIKTIATGWMHTVGLDSKGNIQIAGYKCQEQLSKIKENGNWHDIIAISAGGGIENEPGKGHTVGLRKDGTVVAVGDNEYGQCDVNDWTNIVAISAGDWHTVGLRKDGTVVATKPDKLEGIPSTSACAVEEWHDIVAISAGRGFTLGLTKDGHVVSVGNTDHYKRPKDKDKNWENIRIYEEWDSIINTR